MNPLSTGINTSPSPVLLAGLDLTFELRDKSLAQVMEALPGSLCKSTPVDFNGE